MLNIHTSTSEPQTQGTAVLFMRYTSSDLNVWARRASWAFLELLLQTQINAALFHVLTIETKSPNKMKTKIPNNFSLKN